MLDRNLFGNPSNSLPATYQPNETSLSKMNFSNMAQIAVLSGMSGLAALSTQHEANREMRAIILTQLHEMGRFQITHSVLQSLGTLSTLEAHLAEMSPQSKERLRHIVDAYSLGAIQKISGW